MINEASVPMGRYTAWEILNGCILIHLSLDKHQCKSMFSICIFYVLKNLNSSFLEAFKSMTEAEINRFLVLACCAEVINGPSSH